MKKLCSLLLALLLLSQLFVPALASEGGQGKVHTYTPGQFTDISSDAWCADNVRIAYEYGIMSGKREDYFDADSTVSLAQALVIACRVHDFYCKEAPALPTEQGTPWYQPYREYAEAHRIADFGPLSEQAFYRAVTRADFAVLLYTAIPEESRGAIGSVEDNAIPDLGSSSVYGEAVYALYRAGILTGNDEKGTFTPSRSLSRGAAAALAGRAVDPSLRKVLQLREAPFEPVPLKQLANLKSLRRRASDEEMTQAYNAALKIVTPLARLTREEQLTGIATALREMFDNGMSYSMETPHYNDPYGYFIQGVASCAGCTRATGLCLNMLGIPYEHVNENQYSHQWCRVNLSGTYWICDAFGLYCGPEPAPYTHPYLS